MPKLRSVAIFYREIYQDRNNAGLLLAWYLLVLLLIWWGLLAQDRWVHADINAAAFDREPAHHACAGFATETCYGWLGELDSQRRDMAVRVGACQIAVQCPSTAPEKDPLIRPAPCAGNGGCSEDKALWYKKTVCPASEKIWSRPEIGVIRRLVVGRATAMPCGGGADLAARPDLREAGLQAWLVFLLSGLVAFVFSPIFVAARAFRQLRP